MIVAKKYFDIINTLYFVLDNVMFWEAFRWERIDKGHIYIQKFPNGKMYAGQTTNISKRFDRYINLQGSNPHHTSALKKHIDTMQISITQCPNYLLDAVETFVIAFFDLTDRTKGYNKTTGGRKGYKHTKESRRNMSISRTGERNHMFGKYKELCPNYGKTRTKEVCAQISESTTGEKNHMHGKHHTEEARTKISISNTGKIRTKEARANISKGKTGKTFADEHRVNLSIAKTGEKHPMFGKHHKKETRAKMSEKIKGDKHPFAKPICVLGKLYGSAKNASDILRDVCDTISDDNFIKLWARRKNHQHNVFYVSKEFYNTMKGTAEIITRDLYENWISQL